MKNASNGKKVRRTRTEWERIIESQARSGLSQQAYCEREGIAYSSFMNWRKRCLAGHDQPEVPLIELGPMPSQEAWDVELDLGGGMVVRLRRR